MQPPIVLKTTQIVVNLCFKLAPNEKATVFTEPRPLVPEQY